MNDQCCEGVRPAKFSRRYFMKRGGIAMVGLSTVPAFLQRAPSEAIIGRHFLALRRRRATIVIALGRADSYLFPVHPPFAPGT